MGLVLVGSSSPELTASDEQPKQHNDADEHSHQVPRCSCEPSSLLRRKEAVELVHCFAFCHNTVTTSVMQLACLAARFAAFPVDGSSTVAAGR